MQSLADDTLISKHTYAPVVLFAYRRTDCLRQVFANLQMCPEFSETLVYIFSDAARSEKDEADVSEVRALLATWARQNVVIVEAGQNMGLAKSVMQGVTAVCRRHGRVIVMEDDIVPARQFLSWMNGMLEKYKDCESVAQISGYGFPLTNLMSPLGVDSGFLPYITTWGWATWLRAWESFDGGTTGHNEIFSTPASRRRFDMGGCYPYSKMLRKQIDGKIDSWGIRWYLHVARRGQLTLFPTRSLVRNIGFDAKATHPGMRRFLSHQGAPGSWASRVGRSLRGPEEIAINGAVQLLAQISAGLRFL